MWENYCFLEKVFFSGKLFSLEEIGSSKPFGNGVKGALLGIIQCRIDVLANVFQAIVNCFADGLQVCQGANLVSIVV